MRERNRAKRDGRPFVRPKSKWDAVQSALQDGFDFCGEHFRWLAPSASQMKSCGMWFLRAAVGTSNLWLL
eukprot:675631-Prymnesium_polylepis.1